MRIAERLSKAIGLIFGIPAVPWGCVCLCVFAQGRSSRGRTLFPGHKAGKRADVSKTGHSGFSPAGLFQLSPLPDTKPGWRDGGCHFLSRELLFCHSSNCGSQSAQSPLPTSPPPLREPGSMSQSCVMSSLPPGARASGYATARRQS